MEPLHTTLRLGILLLVLTCFMGVTAQTSKTAQNNGLPVSLPSMNKGDTITEREFAGKVYDVVDEHPHFPGGNGALLDWLSKNYNSPHFSDNLILNVVPVLTIMLIINNETKHLLDGDAPFMECPDRHRFPLAHIVVEPAFADVIK